LEEEKSGPDPVRGATKTAGGRAETQPEAAQVRDWFRKQGAALRFTGEGGAGGLSRRRHKTDGRSAIQSACLTGMPGSRLIPGRRPLSERNPAR